MEMVSLLFSHLTRKKYSIPRVHVGNISPPGRDLFWRAVRRENFAGSQGDTKLKKNGWVLLYLNISWLDILILCLVGILHPLEFQRQHKTFIMSSLPTPRQKYNCLTFLVNRIITGLLLQSIEWLRNTSLHLSRRKKLSHSGW